MGVRFSRGKKRGPGTSGRQRCQRACTGAHLERAHAQLLAVHNSIQEGKAHSGRCPLALCIDAIRDDGGQPGCLGVEVETAAFGRAGDGNPACRTIALAMATQYAAALAV